MFVLATSTVGISNFILEYMALENFFVASACGVIMEKEVNCNTSFLVT